MLISLLKHTPRFEADSAVQLAAELYGIQATAQLLPSERDQNFLLETERGEKVVLKIANALETRSFLEAQNEAISHVAKNSQLGHSEIHFWRGIDSL
jgi:hydroxylysine kinase